VQKILVTGADGFLGSHVVRQALARGYAVRAFIQPGRNTGTLDGLPVERFYADLTEPGKIFKALEDCDYVIHTAGTTAVWPSRSEQTWQINYEVVVELAKAITEQMIKRFVHIGSASSFGYGTSDEPGTEESPYIGGQFKLDYLDSKKAAMDYLKAQYQQNGLPVIILAPTFMIGEYDSKPGSGKMILAVSKRKLPGYSCGGKCIVYTGDVARAGLNALTMGRLGQCYITGGENLTYQAFFKLIAEIAQVRPLRTKIAPSVAVLFGGLLESVAAMNHREPMLSAGMARMAKDGHYYSSQKAITELGMPQTSAREAIERAIYYFKEIGYL